MPLQSLTEQQKTLFPIQPLREEVSGLTSLTERGEPIKFEYQIVGEPKIEEISDGQTKIKRQFFAPKFLQEKQDDNWAQKGLKFLGNFVFSPLIPLGEDVGQLIALNQISKDVATGKLPVSILDEFDILKKTSPQIVGDVAQAVIMGVPFGVGAKMATLSLPLLAKMAIGMKAGGLIGGAFGLAGTLSEEPHPRFNSLIKGTMIGAVVGGGLGAIFPPLTTLTKDFIRAVRGKVPITPITEKITPLLKEIPKPTFVQRLFPYQYENRLIEIAEKELSEDAFVNTPKLNAFQNLLKDVLPIRALTTKDPTANVMRMNLENAVLAQKNRYSKLYDKDWETLKKYSEDDLSKIVALQETATPIKKAPFNLRAGLRSLRANEEKSFQMAKELGIDTGQWRFTPENHFSHMWRGQQVIFDIQADNTRKIVGFADDRIEGLRQLLEYKERFPKSKAIMRPREEIWKTSQPTTALSQKGFWSFIKRMADVMEMTPDEALEEISMQGIAKIKPAKTKIGVFQWRKGELGNYLTDPKKVYPSIWWKMTKALEVDPVLRKEAIRLNKIPDFRLRSEMSDLIDVLSGKFQNQKLDYKTTALITGTQAQLKLGLRVAPALVNVFQRFYGVALTGEKNFLLAQGKIFTKEGQTILEKIGVSVEAPIYETTGRQITKKWYSPLYLFGQTEGGKYTGNRNTIGLAGYYRGLQMPLEEINANLKLRKLPIFESQEDLAINYARQIVNSTQFVYDIVGTPKVMRDNLGKTLLQFKTYGINQVTNTAYVLQGKPLPGLEIFYPKGLSKTQAIHQAIIHFGTLFSQGGIRSLAWGTEKFLPPAALTWIALKHPWMLYGITSFAGIDVSRSSTVELSNLTSILPYQDAKNVWLAIKNKDPEHLLAIDPAALRIYRALEATDSEGYLKDLDREQKIIKLTPIELLEYGAGINPLRVSIEQDLHFSITREKTNLNELSAKIKRDTITALKNNDFDLAINILQRGIDAGVEISASDLSEALKLSELTRIQRDFLKERKDRREEFIKRYGNLLVPEKQP